MYANQKGIAIPEKTDSLYPMLALEHFNVIVGIFFLLGIISVTYSSSDSALTALTTSFCIDFLNFNKRDDNKKDKQRIWVHLAFTFILFLIILIFRIINDESVINTVFKVAGYTYGPLLGLFSFGVFTKFKVKDKYIPFVCVVSPVISYILNLYSAEWFNGFKFGFTILIVNGALTFLGMLLLRDKQAGMHVDKKMEE